jgi:hypothetical protein
MQRLIFFILSLISCTAEAGCYDLTSYEDSKIYIDISDGGCASSVKITSIPIKNGKKLFELKHELEFSDECQFSKTKDGSFLTCRANSKNPLSGATYKQVQNGFEECSNFSAGDKYPAYELRCIKGCESAPSKLPVSYGCD